MIYSYLSKTGIEQKEIASPKIHEEHLTLYLNNFMTGIMNAIVEFEHKMQERGFYFTRANRIAMNQKLFYLIEHTCRADNFNSPEEPAFSTALIHDYNKHEATLFGLKVIIRNDLEDDEVDIYNEVEAC